MKTLFKLVYLLYQVLFYIFMLLSAVSLVFFIFGGARFKTVAYLVLFTFGFLFLHILFYRIYTYFFEEDSPPTPSHLE